MERKTEISKIEHPDLERMLEVLLYPQELVHFNEGGEEIIEQVHVHLAQCDPCVSIVQEKIKFY